VKDVLSLKEWEEFSIAIARGENPFSALASVTDRTEAFKVLAEENGYSFSPTVPEGAEEVRPGVYTDGVFYYTYNPALAPQDKEVVVVPPTRTAKEIDESEIDDFWVKLIARGVKEGWGDVHFEPSEKTYRIRVRNDVGKIELVEIISKGSGEKLLSQIQLKAGMKPEERGVAKDGSINFSDVESSEQSKRETVRFLQSLKEVGAVCNLRLSIIPTVKGESLVLRILPKKKTAVKDLLLLNYTPAHKQKLSGYPKLSQGLIVVSGPTGSGKSTLLQWMVVQADPHDRKIVSVEDPVEAEIDGVQQVEVKRPVRNDRGKVIGIDFSLAMRAFMRQNPEVILVGEVRDPETARAVVEASNTGHLVMTTVHANDEVETIKRLLFLARDERTGEVDVPAVMNALRLVVAQRLLPKLCPSCVEEGRIPLVEVDDSFLSSVPVEAREVMELKRGGLVPYVPENFKGCSKCKNGYVGRVPVVGILELNREVRDFVIDRDGKFTTEEFLSVAKRTGFRDYKTDALEKLEKREVAVNDFIKLI